MSGFEAWYPDGRQMFGATDQLGMMAGSVTVSNSVNPSGQVSNRALMYGTPWVIYANNPTNDSYAPSYYVSNGTLYWNNPGGTWAGVLYYGSY